MWQISRSPCEWCEFGQVFNGQLVYLVFSSLLATELQSYRHPKVLSIQVGEIFLCLISINSPTYFTGRGIILCS